MKRSETQCLLKEKVGCGPQCRRHLEKKEERGDGFLKEREKDGKKIEADE
jgi:hypothetical protein